MQVSHGGYHLMFLQLHAAVSAIAYSWSSCKRVPQVKMRKSTSVIKDENQSNSFCLLLFVHAELTFVAAELTLRPSASEIWRVPQHFAQLTMLIACCIRCS